jgi:hypothetical protein
LHEVSLEGSLGRDAKNTCTGHSMKFLPDGPPAATSQHCVLGPCVPMSASELVVHALRELVDALDRRAARVERLGETHIARESAALRKEAVNRIHELTAVLSDRDTPEGDAPGENSVPDLAEADGLHVTDGHSKPT